MPTSSSGKKCVLITGALTGIGRATALAFAREGAQLVVSGRDAKDEKKGQALAAELTSLGAEAEFFPCDVRRDDQVKELVERVLARFGHLDVAVNNAGTEGHPGPVVDQTHETYAETFDTNVLGTLFSMKHELRAMLPQHSGSIVNLASCYGHEGSPGASVYAASKHAIEGLTRSAALEVVEAGIRVNAVAPGPIETGMLNRFTQDTAKKAGLLSMVPSKRAGTPEEIAEAIVFLSSAGASFMTGAIVPIDGGMSAV
jgi:NAD(P)-dependent dehydrogenase (short-subunit alcohol dehydrogenase family)